MSDQNFALNPLGHSYDQITGGNYFTGNPLINERQNKAFWGQMKQNYQHFETTDVTASDKATVDSIVENIGKYRILGKKIMEQDRYSRLLDNSIKNHETHKMLGEIIKYTTKEGGLTDENAPISFANMKDPGLLIRQDRNFSLTASGSHNKNLDKLVQIAIKSYSPEFAAAILKEAGDGIGVDDKLVKAILVDSKEKMDKNTYNRFITRTAEAYEKYTGKSLDNFIRAQYPKFGLEVSWFGANKKGNQYLAILDNARQNTHDVGGFMTSFGAMGMMGAY